MVEKRSLGFIQGAQAAAAVAAGTPATEPSGQTAVSSTPDFDDVISMIGAIGGAAQQIKSVVQTITGDTGEQVRIRCILGDDVPLGLPDTDPRAWIGPINLGIRVGILPDWLDVCSDLGYGASGTLYGFQSLGLRTPQAWAQIATSSPGSGVAGQGQGFEDMDEAQKRAYIANAAAIGIAATVDKLDSYAPIWAGLVKQQDELGWANKIGLEDVKRALARLSGQGPALVAAGQTAAAPATTTGAGPMEHCFVGEPAERQRCVEQELAANPEAARFYALTQDPWIAVADPNKWFQPWLLAPDGRRYTKIGKGANQRAARTLTAVIGTTVVGGVVIGGALLAFTKGGKKLVKSFLK